MGCGPRVCVEAARVPRVLHACREYCMRAPSTACLPTAAPVEQSPVRLVPYYTPPPFSIETGLDGAQRRHARGLALASPVRRAAARRHLSARTADGQWGHGMVALGAQAVNEVCRVLGTGRRPSSSSAPLPVCWPADSRLSALGSPSGAAAEAKAPAKRAVAERLDFFV